MALSGVTESKAVKSCGNKPIMACKAKPFDCMVEIIFVLINKGLLKKVYPQRNSQSERPGKKKYEIFFRV